MQPDDKPKTRTQWAERRVEEFLGLPLVREFVLRSPQTIDRVQKEVADYLILHGGGGILISQKCQEDQLSRNEIKLESWARKNTKGAVRQLVGALRAGPRPIWCDHPRRGRIEFPAGLPPITHGIVLTEVFQPVDLQPDSEDLPLSYRGTPITYLSVNDFLNLAVELRTAPELVAYFDARRGLPIPELRRIGSEESLFEFYLLNDGCLQGCVGTSDAAVAVAAQGDRLAEAVRFLLACQRYSGLFEHVADTLATRDPQYAAKLPPEWTKLFDNDLHRTNYLQTARNHRRAAAARTRPTRGGPRRSLPGRSGISLWFQIRAMHSDGRPTGCSLWAPRARSNVQNSTARWTL